MQKIKLMLVAVLVVASVGGALAFKAAKGQQLFCGTHQGTGPNFCPIVTTTLKIATGTPVPDIFCSIVKDVNCRTVILDN